MIEVVVSGATGRLGARILQKLLDQPTEFAPFALLRTVKDVSGLKSARVSVASEQVIASGRVLVATAPRGSTLQHVARAAEMGAPTLVATTGFSASELRELEGHASKIPLLIAPNLSPGVSVLLELVRRASAALPDYDLEVMEMHHGRKRDAPSGTAWALARAADEARGGDIERDAILARAGDVGPRGKAEVGMQSLRGGDVIGEHTLFLIGGSERIELTHRAATRDVFADGAIRAIRFLAGRAPGLYSMRDVLFARTE